MIEPIKTVRGNFRQGIPRGVPKNVRVGMVLPESVVEEAAREHNARVKLNISDPSGVRPFIDQPIVEGTIPSEMKEATAAVSRLVHEYRNANPKVIHASAVIVDEKAQDNDIEFLTNMYYKCQNAFTTMVSQVKAEKVLPITPRLENLMWENIGFPRLSTNLHILRAIIIYFEQDDAALVVHLVFIYNHGEATVYSSRLPL